MLLADLLRSAGATPNMGTPNMRPHAERLVFDAFNLGIQAEKLHAAGHESKIEEILTFSSPPDMTPGYGSMTMEEIAAKLERDGCVQGKLEVLGPGRVVARAFREDELPSVTITPATGVDLIADERKRQVEVEKWTAQHDDDHEDGELANAAACYASNHEVHRKHPLRGGFVPLWPWEDKWDKRAKRPVNASPLMVEDGESRIRELTKAGALIAAEIDRLQRRRAPKVLRRPPLQS